jgi:hypothetical protein
MSVQITATIKCDNCGAEIHGDMQTNTAQGATAYWSAKRKAVKNRWLILNRYGVSRHLCQPCADGRVSESA